jgi:adenylate cyclase
MSCDTEPIVAWLVDGARSAHCIAEVLSQLCDRLVDCGIPLWTVETFVQTPHPDIRGRYLHWQRGNGARLQEVGFGQQLGFATSSELLGELRASAATRRYRASDRHPEQSLLARAFRADEVTELLATALRFTDGSIHAATWATREAGGFSDKHVAAIESIVAAGTRVAEIRALKRTTTTLLRTYLGRQMGQRLLAGQIHRQFSETIQGAVLLSDMRAYTPRAERLSPSQLVAMLNRYFSMQVPSILEHGGEVVKFMGDGLLAIFPVRTDRDLKGACSDALAAAIELRANVAELDATGETAAPIRMGVALHAGDIVYGNVGGGDRLDFTCVGPSINLVGRLERLTGPLGRSIVASEAFARLSGATLAALGSYSLPGLDDRQAVFGLAADDRCASPGEEAGKIAA